MQDWPLEKCVEMSGTNRDQMFTWVVIRRACLTHEALQMGGFQRIKMFPMRLQIQTVICSYIAK